MKSILVACPQHVSKEYAFQRWIDAVDAFTYPHDTWVVDNSPDREFFDRWRSKVNIHHANIEGNQFQRMAVSMDLIRVKTLMQDYDLWLCLESDVIAPPNTIEVMLDYADRFREKGFFQESSVIEHSGGADWLAAPYPSRVTGGMIYSAFGCTLFSSGLLKWASFKGAPHGTSADGWYRGRIREMHQFNLVDLNPGALPLEHLVDPNPKPVW